MGKVENILDGMDVRLLGCLCFRVALTMMKFLANLPLSINIYAKQSQDCQSVRSDSFQPLKPSNWRKGWKIYFLRNFAFASRFRGWNKFWTHENCKQNVNSYLFNRLLLEIARVAAQRDVFEFWLFHANLFSKFDGKCFPRKAVTQPLIIHPKLGCCVAIQSWLRVINFIDALQGVYKKTDHFVRRKHVCAEIFTIDN